MWIRLWVMLLSIISTMKKEKWLVRGLAGIMISSAVVVTVSACKKNPASNAAGDPVPVNVALVRKERLAYYDRYPGTVVSLNEVELRSEVGGFVTGIYFKEGDFIRKGQPLYDIDRKKYYASLEQAKANVDIAAANVERAKRYVDRYTKLNEQDAIARQRLDDAQTDLQNASLELVSAKAGLVRAQSDYSYSAITAPFDGTIGLSNVKMGALITPGQTLLNTISTDNPMGVDFVINEKELGRFMAMNHEGPGKNDSTFRILLPDNSLYPQNGKIQVIDRAIDPQTGTIRVRLVYPNSDRRLRPGLSCVVNVLHAGTSDELVIPSKSLLEQMSEYFVFVDDSLKARQVKVTLGAQYEGRVVITSGLDEGKAVVTDGLQKVRNGMPVVISAAPAGGTDQ